MSNVWLFIVLFVKTNPDFPDAVCAGVLLSNSVNAMVRANDIRLQNDYGEFNTESRFYGVYKSNGYDNTICGNDVTGLNGYDRGIGSIMSPGLITCNKLEFTRAGLFFAGENEQIDGISGNEIKDAYAGVQVYSDNDFITILGNQDHQANKWVNNWVYGGLWTGSNIDKLGVSQFLNNENYPYTPDALIISNVDWFFSNNEDNIFTGCNEDAGINTLACEANNGEEGGKIKTLASNPKDLQEPYRSMVLRKTYAQIIADYYNQPMPFEYKNFVNEYSGETFAKLAEIDFLMANPLVDFPIIEQSIEILSDSVQQLIPAYLMYQKTLDDLSFTAHVNLGSIQTNVAESSVLSLSTALNIKIHIADSIKTEKWQKALNLNSNLVVDNNLTQLEQQINAIYLNLLLNNQNAINSNDSALIKTTAYYCPQEYGAVVFKARSLWVQMGNAIDKTWDDCFPTSLVQQGENRSVSGSENFIEKSLFDTLKPLVYPVPTGNYFVLYLPNECILSKYRIFNSLGVMIENGVLDEQFNQFDTSNWSNGIYYIHIMDNGMRPITLKLIVQKL
jgi:hypothetical protein